MIAQFRLQGRVEQLRIEECLPIEIKDLLAEFAEIDKRNHDLQEAERLRKQEVR
jgi:hypothetical protein